MYIFFYFGSEYILRCFKTFQMFQVADLKDEEIVRMYSLWQELHHSG